MAELSTLGDVIKTAYEGQENTNAYTDTEKTKLSGIAAGAQVNAVASVAGKTGAVTLTKADVGLGNVDNTSDANKPASTAVNTLVNSRLSAAQRTAIDALPATGATVDDVVAALQAS